MKKVDKIQKEINILRERIIFLEGEKLRKKYKNIKACRNAVQYLTENEISLFKNGLSSNKKMIHAIDEEKEHRKKYGTPSWLTKMQRKK